MRLGKYQLIRKLATGGMAEVFLAKTDGPMGFEKQLVIKRILPHLAEDPQFVDMFLGEAKLAAQLNHPNLVQLFDFGEAEGAYFIAMEYIDGPTLRLLLARARDLRSPITLGLAARIVSLAAEGLAYAHDFCDRVTAQPLHLVPRDVSPDNILVGRSGAVKLVDFGIAKARGQSHQTQAGTVKGKVAYMAPEQLRGEPLDRRVDLYALGIVLYELCTGRMPFEADSDASMVRAVLYDRLLPAPGRPPSPPAPPSLAPSTTSSPGSWPGAGRIATRTATRSPSTWSGSSVKPAATPPPPSSSAAGWRSSRLPSRPRRPSRRTPARFRARLQSTRRPSPARRSPPRVPSSSTGPSPGRRYRPSRWSWSGRCGGPRGSSRRRRGSSFPPRWGRSGRWTRCPWDSSGPTPGRT